MVEVKGVAEAEDRVRKLIGERHPKVGGSSSKE